MSPQGRLSDSRTSVAHEDLRSQIAAGAQGNPPLLSFADPEFMADPAMRGIRAQIELMRPELVQQRAGVKHHVVVFGSARTQPGHHEYEQARQLGARVARWSKSAESEERLYIATGGGPGIMEAANRGSYEEGWPSLGFGITGPMEDLNEYVDPELAFRFHYFALRKAHLVVRAAALVSFPGGFGTLDEAFEVLNLVNTQKLNPLPIIFVGEEFWSRLIDWDYLVETGKLSPEGRQILTIVPDAESAWQIISDFYGLESSQPDA
ncbi:MAG: LOG family protein [Actinobacteria bacterium]|nr:LOG family protein [Actinomycetota bacterium]